MPTIKITIKSEPRFEITGINLPMITTISELAYHHYDGVCRNAAKNGGFIYGWKNSITWAAPDPVIVIASQRELATLGKVLEMANFNKDHAKQVAQLWFNITQAMKAANEQYEADTWKIELP